MRTPERRPELGTLEALLDYVSSRPSGKEPKQKIISSAGDVKEATGN